MKTCRFCKRTRSLNEFKLMHDGSKFYRRKTCDECANLNTRNYYALREKELALIPNPFEKMNSVQIQDQSHLLWSECV